MVTDAFMPRSSLPVRTSTYELHMRDFKTTIVLAGVALLLVGGVAVLTSSNPSLLLGLAPVLLAIAAIVRAIGNR